LFHRQIAGYREISYFCTRQYPNDEQAGSRAIFLLPAQVESEIQIQDSFAICIPVLQRGNHQ
jgi:hypothetical protein